MNCRNARESNTRPSINTTKNKVVRYDSDLLLKMCVALDCGIEDLIEVVR